MAGGQYTAALAVIGNEILSGRTEDKNLNYLARQLKLLGIRFLEAVVIPDREERIVAAINDLRKRFTYVFTTGGIGPTHDDITSAAIAKAFGVTLVKHVEAERRLAVYYEGRGELNEARLKMASVPKGALLIDNPVSAAPGFQMENVYVLAGVPHIMQAMFEGLKHGLKGGSLVFSEEVTAFIAESSIASALTAIQDAFSDVEIGSYPFVHGEKYGVTLVASGEDQARVAEAKKRIEEMLLRFVEPGKDAKTY